MEVSPTSFPAAARLGSSRLPECGGPCAIQLLIALLFGVRSAPILVLNSPAHTLLLIHFQFLLQCNVHYATDPRCS